MWSPGSSVTRRPMRVIKHVSIERCASTCRGRQAEVADLGLEITPRGFGDACEVRGGEIEQYRAKSYYGEDDSDKNTCGQGPDAKRVAATRIPGRRRAFSKGCARPPATQSNQFARVDPTRCRAADWDHSARVVENPRRKIHRSFPRTADALSDRARLSYRDQNWGRAGKQGRGRHNQGCPTYGCVKRSRLPREGGWMRHPAALEEPRRRNRAKSYSGAPGEIRAGRPSPLSRALQPS